jgi:hypothetical protein
MKVSQDTLEINIVINAEIFQVSTLIPDLSGSSFPGATLGKKKRTGLAAWPSVVQYLCANFSSVRHHFCDSSAVYEALSLLASTNGSLGFWVHLG